MKLLALTGGQLIARGRKHPAENSSAVPLKTAQKDQRARESEQKHIERTTNKARSQNNGSSTAFGKTARQKTKKQESDSPTKSNALSTKEDQHSMKLNLNRLSKNSTEKSMFTNTDVDFTLSESEFGTDRLHSARNSSRLKQTPRRSCSRSKVTDTSGFDSLSELDESGNPTPYGTSRGTESDCPESMHRRKSPGLETVAEEQTRSQKKLQGLGENKSLKGEASTRHITTTSNTQSYLDDIYASSVNDSFRENLSESQFSNPVLKQAMQNQHRSSHHELPVNHKRVKAHQMFSCEDYSYSEDVPASDEDVAPRDQAARSKPTGLPKATSVDPIERSRVSCRFDDSSNSEHKKVRSSMDIMKEKLDQERQTRNQELAKAAREGNSSMNESLLSRSGQFISERISVTGSQCFSRQDLESQLQMLEQLHSSVGFYSMPEEDQEGYSNSFGQNGSRYQNAPEKNSQKRLSRTSAEIVQDQIAASKVPTSEN